MVVSVGRVARNAEMSRDRIGVRIVGVIELVRVRVRVRLGPVRVKGRVESWPRRSRQARQEHQGEGEAVHGLLGRHGVTDYP